MKSCTLCAHPKKKEAKNYDPQSSQTVGGSAWESNPPTAFSRRHTGFEGLDQLGWGLLHRECKPRELE
jgi:hypothetical protein